ncbi:DegT/DnrJ/EryC1/StrS family aminotransferase [Chryseolinea sp. T2]|uniref:DegT/DnrJ/EryC1/StrS family aminotransferase n=1 Tax=Chryseolinea sp. T2 TaxID=3129255 RepID=UPI0030775B09
MEQIPFNRLAPQHDASVIDALLSVVKDDWFVLGKRLQTFESEFARFTGVKHCVGTGNGHDALVLAMKGLGLGKQDSDTNVQGPGAELLSPHREGVHHSNERLIDEILVPANTCTATFLAISNAGCLPVPVEPDAATLNIDPRRIEERITPRTKAIMPVHLYGNPCDMGSIMELARKHDLKVIEDNAQAHGATFRIAGSDHEQTTGSFGEANATSFYPTKNLGALGDGGAVTTNGEIVKDRIRRARNYGYSSKDICDFIGMNSRLDEIQAAVLSVKLARLNKWNEQRRIIARMYDTHLSGCGDLILPGVTPGGKHVYHLYVVQTARRNELQQYLAGKGIQAMVHYPVPPHLQKAYSYLGYKRGAFPIAERLSEQVLSLPLWVGMTDQQVLRVVKEVRSFW